MCWTRLHRHPSSRKLAVLAVAACLGVWQPRGHTAVQRLALASPRCAPGRRSALALLGLVEPISGAGAAEVPVPKPATGKISGSVLPLTVGLGTCLVGNGDVTAQVSTALDCGYRVIDTAQRYGNEEGVGKALRATFTDGRVGRDEIFVTTKVWPSNYGYAQTIKSVQESAKKLGLDAIDLVLPHWPGIGTGIDQSRDNLRLRKETWKALETLKQDGVVKQIGISNYNARHLGELLEYANVKPMASQFEVHPFNTRAALVELCQQEGIRVNGYSPLGGKGNPNQVTDKLLSLPLLLRIAETHGKTPAQVILRWHLQRCITPIPKASSRKRIAENYDVFDFALTASEMDEINALDKRRFAVMDSEVFL